MELAQESLAGRIAILHMPSLSQHEIYGNGEVLPFAVDLEQLKSRKKYNETADIKEIYRRIWNGSMQFFKIIFQRVRAKCMSLTIQWRQFYK